LIDGSGYPRGLEGNAISQAVRVVTIANVFDNLCNQRVVARSKTPSEALAFMYKNELAKYAKTALSAFVKALGVYPPGTIVTLKSGKVGIVMSVDSSDLLHPNLMIYDPGVPNADAAIVNLRRDLEDEVDAHGRTATRASATGRLDHERRERSTSRMPCGQRLSDVSFPGDSGKTVRYLLGFMSHAARCMRTSLVTIRPPPGAGGQPVPHDAFAQAGVLA
jgi:hypothetical protein